MLVDLPWVDHEEVLVFAERPGHGWRVTAPATSLAFAGTPDAGRFLGRRAATVMYDYDGVVLTIYRDGRPLRRVVPDQLVVTGIWGRVLGR